MLLPAILLTVTLSASDTTSKPAPAPPKTIPELEARIQKVLDSTHTPGVGLAIVRHDSIIYAGGIGLARVSPKTQATAATLFRIGSTSKSFVALTALALQEEGKLSLQDPLKQRMPNFYFANKWESTDPVRIVNLLEHTSGFDDNSLHVVREQRPHAADPRAGARPRLGDARLALAAGHDASPTATPGRRSWRASPRRSRGSRSSRSCRNAGSRRSG